MGRGVRRDRVCVHGRERGADARRLRRQRFARLVAAAGVPYVRFHDLRQTHATLLLKAGVPVHVVAQRLGHATPAITLSIYSHVLPRQQSEAAAAFARPVDETGTQG